MVTWQPQNDGLVTVAALFTVALWFFVCLDTTRYIYAHRNCIAVSFVKLIAIQSVIIHLA